MSVQHILFSDLNTSRACLKFHLDHSEHHRPDPSRSIETLEHASESLLQSSSLLASGKGVRSQEMHRDPTSLSNRKMQKNRPFLQSHQIMSKPVQYNDFFFFYLYINIAKFYFVQFSCVNFCSSLLRSQRPAKGLRAMKYIETGQRSAIGRCTMHTVLK